MNSDFGVHPLLGRQGNYRQRKENAAVDKMEDALRRPFITRGGRRRGTDGTSWGRPAPPSTHREADIQIGHQHMLDGGNRRNFVMQSKGHYRGSLEGPEEDVDKWILQIGAWFAGKL
jgi:hypothetical protein